MSEAFGTRREKRIVHLPRAVIDIGSNTVRMVIYEGSPRAPRTVWNEKVAARLGRDLSETGRIPEEASDEALGALARYARILDDLGVTDIQTVATAAARDAENGPEFLAAVAALGLEPRLLTGEEEARISATGAIGAFPRSTGPTRRASPSACARSSIGSAGRRRIPARSIWSAVHGGPLPPMR